MKYNSILNITKKLSACIILVMVASCSATKKVPAGDALYTGAKIKITTPVSRKQKNVLSDDMEKLTRPKPNSKILGIPFKLLLNNFSNQKKKGGLGNYIARKFGQPPVLLSSVSLEYNNKILQNTLENKGFFHATSSGDTTVKRKKATAIYTIITGPQYTVNKLIFVSDSSALPQAVSNTASKTLIKVGVPFNLDLIKAERERIDVTLKEQGFYYFSPDYLIIDADSSIGNNKVNLYVRVKPATPVAARNPYTLDKIYIYSNYSLRTAARDTSMSNAILHDNYYIIDKSKMFKPRIFDQAIVFEKGEYYNRTDHNLSLNRLISLGVYKFVKNRFEPANDTSIHQLDAFYYLTPMPKKTLKAEFTADTKSNNTTGSLVTLSWKNRNTFHGAELLTLNANAGFEVQYSGTYSGFNTLRLGGEANLTFPRFLIPFFHYNTSGAYIPKTNIQLGYDLVNRKKLYTLNSFRGNFGYIWKENLQKQHLFNPIAINYVQPLNVTQIYRDSARKDYNLLKAIDTQFIIGSNYDYTYDQLVNRPKEGGWFLNGNVDLSGNILGLVTGADVKAGKVKELFNAPFSQYVKLQGDIRRYFKVGLGSRWANRLILGFGYPYGNSIDLPFVKQFFIGGTNSIRAFRSRSIGPGTYRDTTTAVNGFLPDQSGDIKLEFNTEMRTHLFSIVEGALFIDAGNVWLYNDNPARLKPGAKFNKDFLNQLYVGAGAGLRFDLTILLLRLDVATPLRKAYLPAGQQWVINQIKFGSSTWRKENLVFNLGIGYPF